MMDFTTWFISQLPSFLMTPPVSAFTAIIILCWVGELVGRMMGISR